MRNFAHIISNARWWLRRLARRGARPRIERTNFNKSYCEQQGRSIPSQWKNFGSRTLPLDVKIWFLLSSRSLFLQGFLFLQNAFPLHGSCYLGLRDSGLQALVWSDVSGGRHNVLDPSLRRLIDRTSSLAGTTVVSFAWGPESLALARSHLNASLADVVPLKRRTSRVIRRFWILRLSFRKHLLEYLERLETELLV